MGMSDDEDDLNPERIEFTVGVCVRMVWDETEQAYTLSRPLVTTLDGLFTNAVDGVWVPEFGEWIPLETDELCDARALAVRVVADAITDRFMDVVDRRLDLLEAAIRARNWEKTEADFDWVLRAVRTM